MFTCRYKHVGADTWATRIHTYTHRLNYLNMIIKFVRRSACFSCTCLTYLGRLHGATSGSTLSVQSQLQWFLLSVTKCNNFSSRKWLKCCLEQRNNCWAHFFEKQDFSEKKKETNILWLTWSDKQLGALHLWRAQTERCWGGGWMGWIEACRHSSLTCNTC